MKKKHQYFLQNISLQTLAAGILFVSSLFVFTYIADENVVENEIAFDTRVMAFVVAQATPLLTRVMLKITFFGSMQFLLPAYIVLVVYLLLKKKSFYAIYIAIVAISSTAVMYLVKQLFKRPRPLIPVFETTDGYSFPSGHSFTSFVFCSILAHILWTSSHKKNWKYFATFLLLLFSISIGVSRVILNVHFATDVIASFCLGIIWVLLSFWILNKIQRRNSGYPEIKRRIF